MTKYKKLFIIFVVIAFLIPLITFQDIKPYQENILGTPTFVQSGFFVVLSFFEVLAFESGVYILFATRKYLKNLKGADKKTYSYIIYILSALLISWWPHDWAHAHNMFGISGLLLIEYGFHVTSIIATVILVYKVRDLLKKTSIN